MEELLRKINEGFSAFLVDAGQRAYKGNKAAGTRSRKASLEITKLLKEWRAKSVAE